MDLKQVFIHNLRKFRNNKDISQAKLAELCETTTNYIGSIEIGLRFPSLKLIVKIGKALKQRGGRPVYRRVGGLGRQHGRDQQAVGVAFPVQPAFYIGIERVEG